MAAHVRSHSLVIPPELSELVLPLVPELREAVEKHYQLPLALSYIVQANVINISILVLEHQSLLAARQLLFNLAVYLKHRRYV
jgi:hypothetical protein